MNPGLEGEEQQEGHHQAEQSHCLGQGEAENGVREQLLLQGRVSRIADDERSENRSDSGPRARHANGGCTGTDELGSRVNVSGDGARLQAPAVDCRRDPGSLQ